ncbi:hypothetical protein [Ruegeria arenilitoris]|uniref:hypothetical protein n=1 Tax=Ruegeria arenilitoris TaxID=1173585 RepID=UPI00147AB284|nr:hypothetical protein [Ruegeria arenilitoris]
MSKTCPKCENAITNARAIYCSSKCRVQALRDKRRAEGLTARGKPRLVGFVHNYGDEAAELKTLEGKLQFASDFIEDASDKAKWDKMDDDEVGKAFAAATYAIDLLVKLQHECRKRREELEINEEDPYSLDPVYRLDSADGEHDRFSIHPTNWDNDTDTMLERIVAGAVFGLFRDNDDPRIDEEDEGPNYYDLGYWKDGVLYHGIENEVALPDPSLDDLFDHLYNWGRHPKLKADDYKLWVQT